jgi:hypothetical protein
MITEEVCRNPGAPPRIDEPYLRVSRHDGNQWGRCRRPRAAAVALAVVLFCLHGWSADALATRLQPATAKAWEQYIQWADRRIERELADPDRFLFEDFLPPRDKAAVKDQLEAGAIVVRTVPSPVPDTERFEIRDGRIHHWWGAVLVPGIQLPALLRFLQDYDHHAGLFADVEKSRLLLKDGNRFRFFFRLKRSKAFVTAIYNTEQECVYTFHSPARVSSRSEATRIAEVTDPGKPTERESQPGNDRGFLWRLVSWWRFEQTDRGVVVEVESASLSREIPAIVNFIPWLKGYINSTPRESLESILSTIRAHGKSQR